MLSINQIRFCRKYFIISLTYAAGKTNKNKLAELKPVLQLVKVSSDKEEEEEYAGGQIAKESTLRNIIFHYWICQLRNGVIRPMNLTKLANKLKISLPPISNPVETKLK